MAIIKSLIDTDLYKITVMRVFLRHFTQFEGRYEFKCRNEGIKFTEGQVECIKAEVLDLCNLRFTESELQWIKSLYYMRDAEWFIEFLRMFQFNKNHICISRENDGTLKIAVCGPLWQIMYFETFVLSIVNEVYFEGKADLDIGRKILKDSLNYVEENAHVPLQIAEFGTRRRYSHAWQKEVLEILKARESFNFKLLGTSNMYFAKEMALTAIGTFGHEFVQAAQALTDVPVARSQQKAFEIWQKEYDGALGHALSDTLGDDKFFRDFGRTWCKLFDGVRHDSGDPIEFGKRVIAHYKFFKINPLEKTIIFSDALWMERAVELNNYFKGQIQVRPCIGTALTNNFGESWKPLNIVMKLVGAGEGSGILPVAKISNNPSKTMCNDEGYVQYLKEAVRGEYN